MQVSFSLNLQFVENWKKKIKTARLKLEIFASDKVGCTKLALSITFLQCTFLYNNVPFFEQTSSFLRKLRLKFTKIVFLKNRFNFFLLIFSTYVISDGKIWC